MKEVLPGIHMIPEAQSLGMPDCNIFVLGTREDFVIIDTGNGSHTNEKLSALSRNGFDLKNCRYLILTHLHLDHIRGASAFHRPIVVSDVAAQEMKNNNAEAIFGCRVLQKMAGDFEVPIIEIARRVHDGEVLTIARKDWMVMHTPGHSKGGLCLFYDERAVLISGDLLFADAIGRMDLYGGGESEMRDSLQRIASLRPRTLLPGHGPVIVNDADRIERTISQAIHYLS
ncbi:MBL fold metallo-hydrolase [Candidatus Woesearchaeota archaeon]|nr:MBL fold metallo-hydrolase [Candidatus Woesearchaeota archaeon]